MTNLYLVFLTLQQAMAAMETIYANMVAAIDSPDLVNVATDQVVDKTDITPEQAVQVDASDRNYPVFGVNAATTQKDATSGYTTAWATPQQRVTDAKYVAPKPSDALMTGVSYDSIEEYDPAWFASGYPAWFASGELA